MDRKEIKEKYTEILRHYNRRKDVFQFYLRALEIAKHGARMERPNGLFYDERHYKAYCDDCRNAHEMLSLMQNEMKALKYKLKHYRMLLNQRR